LGEGQDGGLEAGIFIEKDFTNWTRNFAFWQNGEAGGGSKETEARRGGSDDRNSRERWMMWGKIEWLWCQELGQGATCWMEEEGICGGEVCEQRDSSKK
jgi:hypothetical protein